MSEEAKNKAIELVEKYIPITREFSHETGWQDDKETSKECALISVENEYKSLRELLFNLRSCSVIENEKVYLKRLQDLIDEEAEVKNQIKSI